MDIIVGELVDTYGGDYTYKYVYAEYDSSGVVFYESCMGAKAEEEFVVDDPADLAEYMEIFEEKLKALKETKAVDNP
jgi:hypothetical protein